jgi:hypothetical protein
MLHGSFMTCTEKLKTYCYVESRENTAHEAMDCLFNDRGIYVVVFETVILQ